jgi:hypothetical protein
LANHEAAAKEAKAKDKPKEQLIVLKVTRVEPEVRRVAINVESAI